MKMIPINCCDSRRSWYQNIYSLFYFRLSRLFSATQASVFFFSCYFPYMYNLEKQDKWGSFLSFPFIYPKLFSVLLYLIYGQHLLSFSAKPSFRFYHNSSCSFIFISYYHTKDVFYSPHKTFNISLVKSDLYKHEWNSLIKNNAK